MARRRRSRGIRRIYIRRGGHKRSFTLPLAPIAGLAVGLYPVIGEAMAGNWNWAMNDLTKRYTGFDSGGGFDIANLKDGLLPLVAGLLVHKFVGGYPLNANRALARAGVPIVRI